MTCKECRHCKRCPERSREIPCRDFEIKRELIKGRAKNGQSEGRVKNNWRYADKALKLIGDDKNA